ncbi:dethiobiotin synthase [Nitrosovibrio tenuis]|uniref:ATP-dependent dethiobiotin synthetase BioD n=1 Tax=Nitrosovibrio tenuis TaxID=1233 RepID=A0A1H7QK31_9PROT|nr:dethiobiotin synthase [Nitrosovibrio tenuis]SEL48273.1 dethiobiotin synthetase [Nitrosovibrio tenuis]
MPSGYFVTGTGTGVGKTLVSCALLYAFRACGKSVVGMKPVAVGCENGRWMDVEMLSVASDVKAPRELINPYALVAPIAPHIAAKQSGILIDILTIRRACRELQKIADIVIVEGAGGFLVPLNEREDISHMTKALGLPVILVVGMQLGCLNQALLTAQAVRAAGLPLAGWVANRIDVHMAAFDENVFTLEQRLGCPLLGVLPFDHDADPQQMSLLLNIAGMGAG